MKAVLLIAATSLFGAVISFSRPRIIRIRNSFRYGLHIEDLQIPLVALVGIAPVLPALVTTDRLLQRGNARILDIANYVIKDENGEVYANVARPAGNSSGMSKRPVVILIHQFFGLRARDTELCDELASRGYLAIAPDCFQSNTTSLVPRAISFVSSAAFNDDWTLPLRDMRRVVSHLENECSSWADMENVIVAGFCFGGGLALRYSDLFPSNVRGCAVFYGKPLKSLTNFKCNVYGVFGGRDNQFPPAVVDEMESTLKIHLSKLPEALSVEIRRYPDKAHAFIKDIKCIRDGGDAGDAWNGFESFIKRVTAPKAADKVWGQSFIGQDVCGSRLNDDPFEEVDGKADSWEAMAARIDALASRKRSEESFFSRIIN